MNVAIVALLCHSVAALPAPVCHEEIVIEGDMSMEACALSQPAIAAWKEQSIFRGEQWTIRGYKCAPGGYIIKDAI